MTAEDSQEKIKTRKRRRTWIVVLAVLLVVVQLLCDPFSLLLVTAEKAILRIQLVQARRRWQAAGIDDYDLSVSGYSPLTCIVTPETVHVRAGQPEAPRQAYWEFCDVARSVPQAFAIVEQKLGWEYLLQVRFDRQYGYVAELRYDCNYTHGLLSGVVSDCSGGFRIDSFTPVVSP